MTQHSSAPLSNTPLPPPSTPSSPFPTPAPASVLDFSPLLTLETYFETHGRTAGYTAGLRDGLLEGQCLGVEKGFAMSREVGFYSGLAETWLYILNHRSTSSPSSASSSPSPSPSPSSSPTSTSASTPPRSRKTLESLKALTLTFPLDNTSKAVDVVALTETCRAKSKVVVALLGVATVQKYELMDGKGTVPKMTF